jgi:hypothetical protein
LTDKQLSDENYSKQGTFFKHSVPMDKKKKEQQNPSPIIDGDARPDQLDDQKIRKKLGRNSEKNDRKFSTNRGADVNSIEDFKDEK